MGRFFGYRLTTWWRALKAVFQVMDEKNLSLIAAGVAFFGMLAIFPGLAAIIAIFGLLADPMIVDAQLDLMRNIIPSDAFDLLDQQIENLTSTRTQRLGFATIVSIGAALWSTRAGVAALMRGLNAINRQPNRSGLRHYVIALLITITLVGVAIIALLGIVVAPIVLAIFPLGPVAGIVAEVVRWGLVISVLIVGLSILYRFGPNRRGARMAWVTPGAFITLITWGFASAAFSTYLANFGNYNEVYGSIGAVIAMLMWIYISAFLVLLGAALNVALEDVREERRRREATEASGAAAAN
ncbi:YihY/virulence factor BrkB family protein [Aestuariibius sp. 2305UL40-4]|uniref:YihY/virulence factor BrkB family protein n=1 Tax=Aestuariibius violaceus TaxID=3234132 RepID=UPI00345F0EAB